MASSKLDTATAAGFIRGLEALHPHLVEGGVTPLFAPASKNGEEGGATAAREDPYLPPGGMTRA
eukprot:6921453-Karenia_brevis.AAC.1